MANFIEKNLPKSIRDNMRTLIAAGLGLFLGLQYNDYIRVIFERIFPNTNSLIWRGIILIIMTIVIVVLSVFIQKGLDGK